MFGISMLYSKIQICLKPLGFSFSILLQEPSSKSKEDRSI